MHASKSFKFALLGVAMLLAASAFAANKGSLEILDPVTVNGKQLSAGSYSVRWEGNGPAVELSIVKSGKVVATSPAKLVEMDHSAGGDSAVVKVNPDGSRALSQIRFGGKKYALAIGEDSGAGSSGSR
jgi:hypothetical protein